jgi:hypothetical protein
MDNYIQLYDKLNKHLIFNFKLGSGGIGDLTKFFMYTLDLCITNNIKLYYFVNNITIEKFLKLKYPEMYFRKNNIDSSKTSNINKTKDILNLQNDIYYFVEPHIFYNDFSYEKISLQLQDVFYFSEEVKINSLPFIQDEKYVSIHLRLGDMYLETDQKYVLCKEDVRSYNEKDIFELIEKIHDKKIIFFCDNNSYKLKIKDKYNNIIVTNYDIGHTSLSNTTDSQILNTISEFFLLSNSEHIYIGSNSGFPIMASKFKNVPLTIL